MDVEPKDLPVAEVHKLLLGGVGPRPIALASTISPEGIVNLSPFSFFNAFGANPPTVCFSPSRRVRDNTVKDTYNNLIATGECVIQSVTYAMVQQVSLASTEYESDVDEFVKSGLTPVPSDIVKPPRVKESPFQMECRLSQMVHLGDGPGSGNLAICEVLKFHVDDSIMENGIIHPQRIDLVARMSANFYSRAHGEAIFEVAKPIGRQGIGVDRLPDFIRTSDILTGNNLGQLGNCETLPASEEIRAFLQGHPSMSGDAAMLLRLEEARDYQSIFRVARGFETEDPSAAAEWMMLAAKQALDANNVDFAWRVLLHADSLGA